jgi:hypothetical protein
VSIEHRQAERLEVGYPITIKRMGARQSGGVGTLTNVSLGGACFLSPLDLRPGDSIEIGLPSPHPTTLLKATVTWSRPQKGEVSVGAGFDGASERQRKRIVEMHHAIRAYQLMKDTDEEARLDADQAAIEWLRLYGESFLRAAG